MAQGRDTKNNDTLDVTGEIKKEKVRTAFSWVLETLTFLLIILGIIALLDRLF